MDSKADFYKTIYEYLSEIAKDEIPEDLLKEMTDRINDYYFEQYNRFAIQYPKSVKRYSTFQVVDLKHPTTYEIIIKFLKGKFGDKYSRYAEIMLKMNAVELKTFEKSRDDFYNMF